MTNIPPTRSSSPAAVRMRRYRKHRRLLDQPDIDALIRMKLLKKDQREEAEALQTAVTGLVYRVQDDLA